MSSQTVMTAPTAALVPVICVAGNVMIDSVLVGRANARSANDSLRENTERPVTVEQGSNLVVGRDSDAILGAIQGIWVGQRKRGRVPELWGEHSAERIVADLYQGLKKKRVGMAFPSGIR